MKKKEYLYKIEKELNKYELDNYYDLLYQARDVVNQIDEENIVEILGSPENYVNELFEINEMNPEEIKTKKIESNAKMGIFASILFIIFGAFVFGNGFLNESYILEIICIVTIFFIAFGTFINLIKKQTTVYTMTLALTLLVVIFCSSSPVNVLAVLIFLFGCVNLFENIRARITRKRVIKKDKSFYSNTYSNDETLKVKMSFGAKNINLSDKTRRLKVKSSFGETTINASRITHDLVIDINGSFGKINIELPKDAFVVDNCSVSFGSMSQSVRNGNGPVITLNGKFSFGEIEY